MEVGVVVVVGAEEVAVDAAANREVLNFGIGVPAINRWSSVLGLCS